MALSIKGFQVSAVPVRVWQLKAIRRTARGDSVTPPVAVPVLRSLVPPCDRPKVAFSYPALDFELFVSYDSKRHQLLSLIRVWVREETQL